jgi:hypothetical protein
MMGLRAEPKEDFNILAGELAFFVFVLFFWVLP